MRIQTIRVSNLILNFRLKSWMSKLERTFVKKDIKIGVLFDVTIDGICQVLRIIVTVRDKYFCHFGFEGGEQLVRDMKTLTHFRLECSSGEILS